MSDYEIQTTGIYRRDYQKFTKKDKFLKDKVDATVKQLMSDPFYTSLKTHKVISSQFGRCYSSRATGDLRILWDFIQGKKIILALALGGHEGKRSVYRHEWKI